ncbi:unnamed protein product [Effrenium voratum]|nr:unnamed protein product [Effrenium voratum]
MPFHDIHMPRSLPRNGSDLDGRRPSTRGWASDQRLFELGPWIPTKKLGWAFQSKDEASYLPGFGDLADANELCAFDRKEVRASCDSLGGFGVVQFSPWLSL